MLPHLAEVVDEICIVKSVHTDQFNHAPAQIFFNTGFSQPGRPSLGSWVLYGLGSEAQDLPAFVVMSTGSGISGGAANWSSGFLPTVYTGVRLRNQGDPILDVSSPPGVDAPAPARLARPDRRAEPPPAPDVGDPEIATRIAAYEMAFRLQTSAPELMDLRSESKETLRALRRRSGQALVRAGLPAGAADDRARRAVREHLPRRLGRPLRRRGQPQDATAAPPTGPPPR